MTLRLVVALLVLLLSGAALARDEAPLKSGAHDVVINGVRLWYRVAGEEAGAPAVFLHGGPGQGSQTFARFAGPELERSQRMIYLDQRGSGRSEKHWKKEYSIALLVDDLEVFVARLIEAGVAFAPGKPLDGYVRGDVADPFGNRIELMQRL